MHLYLSVFGQYIITPEVYNQPHEDIVKAEETAAEIELTSALDKVREKFGMIGVQLKGRMFDMGNYNAFINCTKGYSKKLIY